VLHLTGHLLLSIRRGVLIPTICFMLAAVARFESVLIMRKVFSGIEAVAIMIAHSEDLKLLPGPSRREG
jgi:hypothetical protein